MIFLIDHVLPDSYFANNLRALSVDMAVFRELLHFKLPDLAQHLDKLQKAANDSASGRLLLIHGLVPLFKVIITHICASPFNEIPTIVVKDSRI